MALRSFKRNKLDHVDLIHQMENHKAPYLIAKYNVSNKMFYEVLAEQKETKRAEDKLLRENKIFDSGYEDKMINLPSDGAWSRSWEKQYLINNRF